MADAPATAAPATENDRFDLLRGLTGPLAAVVVVGAAVFVARGPGGVVGHLARRSDLALSVALVAAVVAMYRPFARALIDGSELPWRRHLRAVGFRVVPLYWCVVVFSYLFATAADKVMPTTEFAPAPAGTTSIPFADLLRHLAFISPYTESSAHGPVPAAWFVSALVIAALLLPLAAHVIARNPDRRQRLRTQWALVAAGIAVGFGWRLALAVMVTPGPTGLWARTWFPGVADLVAVGIALAITATTADAPAGTVDRARSAAQSVVAKASGRGVIEAAWVLAVVLFAVTALVVGHDASRDGGTTANAFGAVAVVLSVLVVGPLALTPTGGDPGGPVRRVLTSKPLQIAGVGSLGAVLWAPVVIDRWVSPLGPDGMPIRPARHPGAYFATPVIPLVAWTVVVTVLVTALVWLVVQRPWLRYLNRPLGPFLAGLWTISIASFLTRVWGFGTVTKNIPGNGDPFFYHGQANMLADGVGFGEPIQWLTEGRFVASAIHPPVFTLWLTPASMLGARGFIAHKTMAAIAGTLVVVVAGLLARRIAGDRAGLIAAVLVALYPNLWIIDGTLWPEGLYTATVGLALLTAYRWRDRPTFASAALVGAACGVAILTRGEALLLLPLLCLPLAFLGRKREPRWFLHLVVMGVAAAVLVLPWTIRNQVEYGQFVPVSTNSQEVLYYANCDDSYNGIFVGYWSFPCQQRARQERLAAGLPADPPGNEAERANAWGEMGVEYAKHHKRRIPYVVAARVARVWDLRYADNNAQAIVLEGRPHNWAKAGLWTWRLLLIPGLVGLWILRRRRAEPWPLVMMLVAISATAVYAYGHIRFRTVGDLVIILGAAVFLDALWRRWRSGTPLTQPILLAGAAAEDLTADARAAPLHDNGDHVTDARSDAAGAAPDEAASAAAMTERADVAVTSAANADDPGGRPEDATESGSATDAAPSNREANDGPDGEGPATPAHRRWDRWRFDGGLAAVVALVSLALFIPLRALMRYQGPPMEEGFMLVFPELVMHGEAPHKDFLHLYGPGSLWFLALWYRIVGVSIAAERIFGLAQLSAIIFGVMALVRPWGRRAMAASGLFGVLISLTAIGLTALAWDGAVALLVWSVWAGLRGRRWLTDAPAGTDDVAERNGLRWLAASGFIAGLALLFRPDVVIAAIASVLVLTAGLAWRHRLRWVIAASISGLGYLYLFATAGPGTALDGMLIEPVFDLRGGRSLPRPPSWDHFDGALQKVASLREPSWWLPALKSPQQAFVWFFLLPIVILFVLGVGWWRVRSAPDSWKARVLLTVGALGAGLMPQALQRPDSTHLAWVSCVPLAFLPAAITELLQHLPVVRAPWRRWAGTAAAVVTLLIPVFVIPHFTTRTYVDLARQSASGDVFGWPVHHDGRTFYLGSEEIAVHVQQMIDEIGPQMTPGQKLIVGTVDLRKTPYSDAYLYYLFPKQAYGTRYIEMDPGMANADDSGLADEVKDADWLMLSNIWNSWSEPNDSLEFGAQAPNDMVTKHFCKVGSYGPDGDQPPYFEVYRRCR